MFKEDSWLLRMQRDTMNIYACLSLFWWVVFAKVEFELLYHVPNLHACMYEPLRDKTNPGLHQNTFLKTPHKSRVIIAHHCNLDSGSERMRAPTSGKVDEPVTQSALCALLPRSLFYTNLQRLPGDAACATGIEKAKDHSVYEWVKELCEDGRNSNGDCDFPWFHIRSQESCIHAS